MNKAIKTINQIKMCQEKMNVIHLHHSQIKQIDLEHLTGFSHKTICDGYGCPSCPKCGSYIKDQKLCDGNVFHYLFCMEP